MTGKEGIHRYHGPKGAVEKAAVSDEEYTEGLEKVARLATWIAWDYWVANEPLVGSRGEEFRGRFLKGGTDAASFLLFDPRKEEGGRSERKIVIDLHALRMSEFEFCCRTPRKKPALPMEPLSFPAIAWHDEDARRKVRLSELSALMGWKVLLKSLPFLKGRTGIEKYYVSKPGYIPGMGWNSSARMLVIFEPRSDLEAKKWPPLRTEINLDTLDVRYGFHKPGNR